MKRTRENLRKRTKQISNLLDREFKITIIKMFCELRGKWMNTMKT